MPVPYSCPHCGATSLVDDQFVGQSGACFTCGKTISIELNSPQSRAGKEFVSARVYNPAANKKTASTMAVLTFTFALLVAGTGLIALALWLMVPVAKMANQTRNRQSCQDNLRAIATAMQRFCDANGHFPPPYVADENGQPKHSWRVLLLPYLGEQTLFSQYDMSEPWDSPKNLAVAQSIPKVYACPSDPNANTLKVTNYMVLVGPRTMFPENKRVTRMELRDDQSQIIMVVETTNAGVGWTEPVDISTKNFQFIINKGTSPQMGSLHTRGMNVLMSNGSVYFMDEACSPDLLEALSTIDGGEVIPTNRMLTIQGNP